MLRGVLGRFVIFLGACGAHPSSMHPIGRACAPPLKSRLRAPLPLTAISISGSTTLLMPVRPRIWAVLMVLIGNVH